MSAAAPPVSEPVRTRREDGVLVITVDNPPVNALGYEVRRGLMSALEAAKAEDVKAVVLSSTGSTFLGGADIREFGKPRRAPLLAEVCERIEALDKPVVAALQGPALGGGLEVALAAHWRCASDAAEVAFPEVRLGLMPGAGGTQRAPRRVGAATALDLMLTGRRMTAREALGCGLIDRLVDEPLAEAVAWARSLADQGQAPRRTRDAPGLADRAGSRAAIDSARAAAAAQSRGLFSPMKIVEAVDAALQEPFEAGLRLESELFRQCLESPQRQGLIYAFLAERAAVKVPEAGAATPRPVQSVGVVGGGTMGAGIAVALLDAGLRVHLVEVDEPGLARGLANVERIYEGMLAKGRIQAHQHAERRAWLTGSTAYGPLAGADLVIEAVFEDMALKRSVFDKLVRACKPQAVLASNTSYLNIEELAAATPRPQDIIGLHFFSPANVMKLLEVVVPRGAAADAVATGFALARRLGKIAVRAGVCDGFIGNRVVSVCWRAAQYIVEDGASPYEVDQALRGFGFAMGPFRVSDLAGGDIGWATRKRRAPTRDPRERYVQIADRLCERGWFGQKSGRGWYRYAPEERAGRPDPEVLAIVDLERRRAGVSPRSFAPEEIVRRYLAAMVNEASKVVREGIAQRPLDVDVVLVNGYGFPRHLGGPMNNADRGGLPRLVDSLRELATEDAYFWEPAALLRELAERGLGFDSLNRLSGDDGR